MFIAAEWIHQAMASTLMLLSNPYRPDPRVLREARALRSAGIEVGLIAWDREGGRPEYSTEEEVKIIRVGPRASYRSLAGVAIGLVRFWMKAFRAGRKLDFDVVHCHDFDTLPLGLIMARLRGKPLILDAHDIYSYMIVGESRSAGAAMWPIERRMASLADGLIATNEVMGNMLAGRTRRATIIRNSPDLTPLSGFSRDEIRQRYGLSGFVVPYFGSLEPGRAVEGLVRAFSETDGINVVVGGSGTLQPVVEEASRTNSAVRFLGSIQTDEVLRVTCASDIVPAMYDPADPKYRVCTPIKVLEAMACGRPVVTSKGLDVSKMVERVGCGFVIDYSDSELVRTIREAVRSPQRLDEMGMKGKAYFKEHLAWESSRSALIDIYRAQAGPM